MRRLCVDQANAFIAEQKNEHNWRERSAVRWLGRVLGPSLSHCKHAAGRVQGFIPCW